MAAMRPGAPSRGPKPFGYVPLHDGPVERAARLLQGHERYLAARLNGRLEGTLEALSPIHVGNGAIERTARVDTALAEQAPLLLAHARTAGRPVLPGSTLKGAIRAVVEAITPSCLGVRARLTALPPSLAELETCPRRGRQREEAYCAACRLFGALGYEGRLRFSDAPLVEGGTAVHLAPPLPPSRLTRGGPPPGRKFYRHGTPGAGSVALEVCPVGARFRFRLDFANLGPAELGLLLVALGQGTPPLTLKLGGYKPGCLGSLRATVEPPRLEDARARATAWDAPAEAADGGDLAPYLAAVAESGLLLEDRLARLAEIVRYPGEGECPATSG